MSSYVVLARKWRPAQFSDIVGQTHIVRTLMNAIRANRVHQAYLFTGSRGVGKTSIARIFAKVLRCEHNVSENDSLRSCDQCSSCKEIAAGNSVDVLEIDGASNNGVESVREIRENAKYMPTSGTKKIYIIDEVHMLTTAAFNALLKTLEEPPAHVIFIFATTEPHKIPATILSRCQRFDFRRVTSVQIQNRLTQVIEAEKIQAENGALATIARAAEGSMRDALSLLDQVIAFSGSQISVQSVRESVGLIDGQFSINILSSIFKKAPLEAVRSVEKAFEQGHDLKTLTRNLIEFLHAVILAKIGSPDAAGLEVSEEEWKEIQAIAELRPLEEMELIFQVLHHGLEWIARSPQPKIVLDILLIKCAAAEALVYVDSVQNTKATSSALPSAQPQSSVAPTNLTLVTPPAVTAPVPSPVSSEPASKTTPAPTPEIKQPASPANSGEKTWEGLIEHIRRARPLLASILEHSSGAQLPQSDDHIISVYFSQQDAYFREQLQARVYQEQLNAFCKDYFGRPARIQIETRQTGESLIARKEREEKEKIESIRKEAQSHPIIVEAKSLFGGELGPIEVNSNEGRHATL